MYREFVPPILTRFGNTMDMGAKFDGCPLFKRISNKTSSTTCPLKKTLEHIFTTALVVQLYLGPPKLLLSLAPNDLAAYLSCCSHTRRRTNSLTASSRSDKAVYARLGCDAMMRLAAWSEYRWNSAPFPEPESIFEIRSNE